MKRAIAAAFYVTVLCVCLGIVTVFAVFVGAWLGV